MDGESTLKGARSKSHDPFKSQGHQSYSGTAEAKVVKFDVHVSYLVLALGRQTISNGRGQCHVTHFIFMAQIKSLEWLKLGISN